jgi:hypothetical protein
MTAFPLEFFLKKFSEYPWTNFNEQDETRAELSTIEDTVCMLGIYFVTE